MSKGILRVAFILLVAVGAIAVSPSSNLWPGFDPSQGRWFALDGSAVAQPVSGCNVATAPTTPNPLVAATEYPYNISGAQYTVNGHTVQMYVYTPHSLTGSNRVLIFVPGGGFSPLLLNTGALSQARGIGLAFEKDTSNVLTLMPIAEAYTPAPFVTGETTPPPPSGTPAAYEQALDVGCAVAWAKQYSYLYGASSTPHIVLVGYSAGAGVVASVMVAANNFIPNPAATLSDVHGVITMSGNYDYKKAEDAGDAYTLWYYKRGSPNGSLETSPLQLGSPTPSSSFNVPWVVEYEQCDADEHYANAEHLASNLVNGWNGGSTYVYENLQHYYFPGAPATPTPTGGVAVHGDGQYALALSSTTLYSILKSMFTTTPATPAATPTWETVPQTNVSGIVDVQSVAAGTDGSVWVLSTSPPGGSTVGYQIGKYGNAPDNAQRCLTPLAAPGGNEPANAIAVDNYGDPWVVDANDSSIKTLPGGFIAAAPTPIWTVDGAGFWYQEPNAGGNGVAATFAPAGSANGTEIGAGGGTLSGTATPPVYLNYSRNVGSVWISTMTTSPTSPPDFTLAYFNGSSWTSHTGWGTQIAGDQSGNAWIVTHAGLLYTTAGFGICSSGFCSVNLPSGSRTGIYIGSGGSNIWTTTNPSPNTLWYLQFGSTTWNHLTGFEAGGPITGTYFGLPIVRKTDNSLNIYHTCTWSDGSPADGSSPCGFP